MKNLPLFENYSNPFLSYKRKYDEDDSHDSNCLMIEVSPIQYVERLQEQISPDDLYDDGSGSKGLETCTHITILYGISQHVKLTDFVRGLPRISNYGRINITGLTLFENEKFDVLKFDVDNPLLNKAFEYMELTTENENQFPEYHGHITICYLKPGTGKKYVNSDLRISTMPTEYRYSSKNLIEQFVI